MEHALIQLESLTQKFKQGTECYPVLEGIEWSFKQGVSYAITGPSGTGKSTLLNLLAGLDKPSSGKILYNNQDITHFTAAEHELYLHQAIGFLFQVPYLIDELSVRENVMLKGMLSDMPYEIAYRRAQSLLEKVDLLAKADARPATLSGGEQQRVALIRSIFLQPSFVLIDEPTAHVDGTHRALIVALLKELMLSHSVGIIMVTHDVALMETVDVVLRIENKKLVKV